MNINVIENKKFKKRIDTFILYINNVESNNKLDITVLPLSEQSSHSDNSSNSNNSSDSSDLPDSNHSNSSVEGSHEGNNTIVNNNSNNHVNSNKGNNRNTDDGRSESNSSNIHGKDILEEVIQF